MSVLIKGMEMPTNCWFCSVKSWDDYGYVCPFSGRIVKSGDVNRQEDCPLIELHDHGDLIDRDAFIGKLQSWALLIAMGHGDDDEWVKCIGEICAHLYDDPVVIPAERSER